MLSLIAKRMTRNSVHDFTNLSSRGIKATLFGRTTSRKISFWFHSPPKIDPYADKTVSEMEEIYTKSQSELQTIKKWLRFKEKLLKESEVSVKNAKSTFIWSNNSALLILFVLIVMAIVKIDNKLKNREPRNDAKLFDDEPISEFI